MKNEKLCCGIDVSQNTLDVACQNNPGNIFHVRVGNNNKGFETILPLEKELPPCSSSLHKAFAIAITIGS
ncbi:hypothetical protein [Ilyomonas limi]|uniref:hypothetical protein n=1 Tax=Ilyomonas limi TaxID=2575867 RepID=UPI00148539E4|nr:hypothetical protein [Ilyomonas limi]